MRSRTTTTTTKEESVGGKKNRGMEWSAPAVAGELRRRRGAAREGWRGPETRGGCPGRRATRTPRPPARPATPRPPRGQAAARPRRSGGRRGQAAQGERGKSAVASTARVSGSLDARDAAAPAAPRLRRASWDTATATALAVVATRRSREAARGGERCSAPARRTAWAARRLGGRTGVARSMTERRLWSGEREGDGGRLLRGRPELSHLIPKHTFHTHFIPLAEPAHFADEWRAVRRAGTTDPPRQKLACSFRTERLAQDGHTSLSLVGSSTNQGENDRTVIPLSTGVRSANAASVCSFCAQSPPPQFGLQWCTAETEASEKPSWRGRSRRRWTSVSSTRQLVTVRTSGSKRPSASAASTASPSGRMGR